MKNKKLHFIGLSSLVLLVFGLQNVLAAPSDTPPSPNAPDATFNSITAINSTIPKLDILEAFCRIMSLGDSTDPDGYTMVSNPNPCTVKFNKVATDNKTMCEGFGGSYASGTRECSWNKDQEFSNVMFCMMAGSPNPYVSNNACIWSSIVANFKGGIKVSGPIQSENYNTPITLSNLGGFQIYAREPEKQLFFKVYEEYGKNGEIGYTDGVTGGNDGLSILAPRGIQLFSSSKSHSNMNLSINSKFYGPTGKYSNVIYSYNEQSKNTPVMFEGIDVDAIYNSGVSGDSGLLDKDGQSVGIRTNGHRAGIIATAYKQLGAAAQSGTYTLYGQSFAGAGIYASGPSYVKNAGAGLFVGTGSSVNTRLAFSDSTGKIWAMNANGDIRVNGNATKTSGGASWTVASDSRLKNVKENFSRGLDDLMQINPIVFKYKKDNALELDSENENVGVIAQEVQKIIPEAVDMDDSGYLTVNNDPIIWTMLNSIKELKKENDILKKNNADLAKRLEALEKKL